MANPQLPLSSSILQWNVRSLNDYKITDLLKYTSSHNIDILCLQETHLNSSVNLKIPGYDVLRKDRSSNRIGGGVAILVRSHLKFCGISLPDFSHDIDAIGVKLWLANMEVTVINLYNPNGNNNGHDFFNFISNNFSNSNLVVVGDFNAHSSIWGYSPQNNAGKYIEEFLTNFTNIVLATPRHLNTYFSKRSGSYSTIDLQLVSSSLINKTTVNRIDNLLSDHFAICTKIGDPAIIDNFISHYVWQKADWPNFSHILSNHDYSSLSTDPNQLSKNLTSLLLDAAKLTIPQSQCPKTLKNNKPPKPWWTSSCQEAWHNKRNAIRSFKRNPSTGKYIAKLQAEAKLKRTIKLAKEEACKNFLLSVSHKTQESKIHKFLDKMCGKFSTQNPFHYQLTLNGQQLETNEEKAKFLADFYEKKFKNTSHNPPQISLTPHFDLPGSQYLLQDFTMIELNKAINSIKPKTSCSHDQIHPSLLQHLPIEFKKVLLSLFNNAWSNSFFPSAWKTSLIIPILKQNKPKEDPNSFRPIMITPVLGKLYEKIIHSRLYWFAESNHLIPHTQTAFRKYHSSIDAFVRLTNAISECLKDNQILVAAFLDFQNAYDNIQHPLLLQKLSKMGFPIPVVNFFKSYLSERSFVLQVNSYITSKKSVSKGLPQGAVLSCLLFSLYLWDLNLPQTNIQFADDIVLWSTSNNFELAQSKLQKLLYAFECFSNNSCLPTAPSKSAIVQFHNRRNPQSALLTLNGVVIQEQQHIKYLGLTLDQKLTFRLHIENVRIKCLRKMRILQRLLNTPWGCHEKTLINFYKTYIRSQIDYGLIVYGSCSNTLLCSLETVQNTMIRAILGLRNHTKTNFLLSESGLTSIAMRRDILLARYFTKIEGNSSHRLHDWLRNPGAFRGLAREFATTQMTYPIPSSSLFQIYPRIPSWANHYPEVNLLFAPAIKTDLSLAYVKSLFHEFESQRYIHHLPIFVDGSKTESRTACGVHFPSLGIAAAERLQNDVSIMTAEIAAINIALETIIKMPNPPRNTPLIIYSDSKSALASISPEHSDYPDNDTSTTLVLLNQLLKQGISTKFQYIPSHMGIKGNHKADEIAKSALQLEIISGRPIPVRDVNHWRLKIYLANQCPPNLSPFTSRKDSKMYHRIRSNATGLNSQTYLYQNTTIPTVMSPLCRLCQTYDETINHVLFGCPVATLNHKKEWLTLSAIFKRLKLTPNIDQLTQRRHSSTDDAELFKAVFNCLNIGGFINDV